MLGRFGVWVAGALLVGLVLTSCGGGSESPSSMAGGSVASAPSTTVSGFSATERAFLGAARTRFPGRSDAQLIALGETACDAIESFGSVELTLLSIAEDPDWSLDEARNAGYLFGISIPVFCPRFEAEARRLVN